MLKAVSSRPMIMTTTITRHANKKPTISNGVTYANKSIILFTSYNGRGYK